jgi:hypothetical protein
VSKSLGLTNATEEYMHQVTVIEPKWLSEVAPTFFRVADQNKISKRKQTEKIEPLFDRFATDKDEWVSLSVRQAADVLATQQAKEAGALFPNIQLRSILDTAWPPGACMSTFSNEIWNKLCCRRPTLLSHLGAN